MNVIIVVDDSDLEAELAVMALQASSESMSIIHLKDGRELVDFLMCEGEYRSRMPEDNHSIRLILLDINMPRLSGLGALEIIKSNPDLTGIPIAILSSSEAKFDIVKSYNLGANSYIKKLVDFEKFKAAMSDTVNYWLKVNRTVLSEAC